MAFCSIDSWERRLDLFECDKHDDIPAADTHEVRCEALVEGEWTLVLEHGSNEAKYTLLASRLHVHDSSFEYVNG